MKQQKIEKDLEVIKKIHEFINNANLKKYPDHMTYESMRYALKKYIEEEDIDTETIYSLSEDEEGIIDHVFSDGFGVKIISQNDNLEITSHKNPDYSSQDQQLTEVVVLNCPDGSIKTFSHTLGTDLCKIISDTPHLNSDQENNSEEINQVETQTTIPFDDNSYYADFKDASGIISSQCVSGSWHWHSNGKLKKKLHSNKDLIEIQIYEFEKDIHALSNISLHLSNSSLQFEGVKLECVLKIDNKVISSQVILMSTNGSTCKFIEFPNIIVQCGTNLTSIAIRCPDYLAEFGFRFDVLYDEILLHEKSFDNLMQNYIFNYMLKTTSNVIINANDFNYKPKYYDQFLNTIGNDFKSLYISENLSEHDESDELNAPESYSISI
ncbi:hypothetical protein Indivirus_11_4 [Indivirus ILV1]|uniref:Uncharacterized protein n=1 Tax=Indivirus ILV1 TaxID=1977633 RepID=A0A1V0SEA7_9VIRU|nr:hypothetical protein Indivirus_11_4 [Indivirus ILV1]